MNFVYIDKGLWKILGDHAKREFPEECIGYFEAVKVLPGSIRLTNIVPCKSVIRGKARRTAAMLSRQEDREMQSLIRKNRDKIYGVYHSHPESGAIYLGEKDIFLGKIYRRFRNQIIVGVSPSGTRTKKAYWLFSKPEWKEVQILVK